MKKPRYAFETYATSSPSARSLLRGASHQTDAMLPQRLDRSPADRVRRWSDYGSGASQSLIVRWTVQHRKNAWGAHILHQPRIVGLMLASEPGEPVRTIAWGPRARALALKES